MKNISKEELTELLIQCLKTKKLLPIVAQIKGEELANLVLPALEYDKVQIKSLMDKFGKVLIEAASYIK